MSYLSCPMKSFNTLKKNYFIRIWNITLIHCKKLDTA